MVSSTDTPTWTWFGVSQNETFCAVITPSTQQHWMDGALSFPNDDLFLQTTTLSIAITSYMKATMMAIDKNGYCRLLLRSMILLLCPYRTPTRLSGARQLFYYFPCQGGCGASGRSGARSRSGEARTAGWCGCCDVKAYTLAALGVA